MMSSSKSQPFPVLITVGPAYRKRQALANAPYFAPNLQTPAGARNETKPRGGRKQEDGGKLEDLRKGTRVQ